MDADWYAALRQGLREAAEAPDAPRPEPPTTEVGSWGKDVYLEKPVSHNVWEGRQVVPPNRGALKRLMVLLKPLVSEGREAGRSAR